MFSPEAGVRREPQQHRVRDAECRGSDAAGRQSATAEGRSRAGFLRYGTILLAMLFFLCCVCVMPAAAVDVDSLSELQSNLSDPNVGLITITKDIAIDGNEGLPEITRKVTITSTGNRIYRTGANTSTTTMGMFTIGQNGQLILNGSVVLDGGLIPDNTQSLVYVRGGGVFNLTENAVLKNNTAENGGGVYVSGTFNMTGGTISGNEANIGGGVYVSGTFTMTNDALVDKTNEVYLPDGKTITFNGVMTSGGANNITRQSPNDGTIIVTNGAGNLNFFGLRSSTMSGWKLVDDNTNLVLSKADTQIALDNNTSSRGTTSVTATMGSPDLTPSTITKPTRTGYTFGGWYNASTGGVCVIDTDDKLKDSVTGYTGVGGVWTNTSTAVTLYANWTRSSYTVTFDSQGGSSVSSQTISHGGTVTEPADPTQSGFDFEGWYKEAACTNPWDFTSDTVTSASTLYANWTRSSYTVTFDSQ
ncbi:MAG: InlB B-repeat-containing protein, partial [Methanocorpusculum sp.]|nr:InlB B-repeat-containing protein [Methanocorpusculum sp.]